MLFERFEASGLAHYSYLVGDGTAAAVIDPRRDAAVYQRVALRNGMRITTILETHRHEDFVSGSVELASRTGARIYHADAQLAYAYGEPTTAGQRFPVGRLALEALATPGHTPGSVAYLLYDPKGRLWMAFSGDTLFAGDVGRVDLVEGGDPLAMAELLYDSLHRRLLPLGDEVIVCPAHGAGSVCGVAIAERMITTIGLERRFNPRLQLDRSAFLREASATHHRPPYFRRVELLNVRGAPLPRWFPLPEILSSERFAAALANGAAVLDVRSELAFGAAHIPGAISIGLSRVSRYVGSLVPLESPLLLVGEGDQIVAAACELVRLGYDQVVGSLADGMSAWSQSGRAVASVDTVSVQQLCELLDDRGPVAVLDVRTTGETLSAGEIEVATHISLVELPVRLQEVPPGPLYIFCGSGARAMTAASVLAAAGRRDLHVVLGGVTAWRSVRCPLRFPERPRR